MTESSDFFSHFSVLPDPRIDHTKKHLLMDILFISVCTIICGGETYTDMEEFGKAKEEWWYPKERLVKRQASRPDTL